MIGSVPSPLALVLASTLVVAVAFFVGERFLAGWAESSFAEAAAPRFLGVLGAALAFSVLVSLLAWIDQPENFGGELTVAEKVKMKGLSKR